MLATATHKHAACVNYRQVIVPTLCCYMQREQHDDDTEDMEASGSSGEDEGEEMSEDGSEGSSDEGEEGESGDEEEDSEAEEEGEEGGGRHKGHDGKQAGNKKVRQPTCKQAGVSRHAVMVADPCSTSLQAAAAMAVGVGSFSDPQQLQGLSHYLEHMLFMGSERYPDENDYDAFLSKHGGSSNAYTELVSRAASGVYLLTFDAWCPAV